MKLSLYYEAKPWKINQAWGVENPIYEQFGFKRHNGIDIAPGMDKGLYTPFECFVTKIAYQPTGAGHYICLLSKDEFQFDDGQKAFVEITYMHLEKTLVGVGSSLKVGDKFAVCDNTGFSTGPHTHIAHKRVKKVAGGYVEIDFNDAKGTFNALPHYNGEYAVDQSIKSLQFRVIELANETIRLLNKLLGR